MKLWRLRHNGLETALVRFSCVSYKNRLRSSSILPTTIKAPVLFPNVFVFIWFDRKKCFTKTTNEMLTIVSFSVKWLKLKLHLVIWQKNCFCLTFLDEQIFKSFWNPNPWMNLLDFFFYYISFYSIFCSLSPFHREWLALLK